MVVQRKSRLGVTIIGDLVMQSVKSNPTLSTKGVIMFMKMSYGIDIAYWKAWRILESARNHLRWYCEAIRITNPGSVVDIQKNNKTQNFERIFIAFKACIDGFKTCRLMLFIDGTFMKGRAKDTLQSATAKDGHNGLFPVTFAIVSCENTDNWS
ncbi:hypothetical protein ACS0TY_034692 [Phlomoides rotata]